MSKLFYTETGRTIYLANEELSSRRRARKLIQLPSEVQSGGTLYIYATPHPGCELPLQVAVNGRRTAVVASHSSYLHWHKLPVEAADLRGGGNVIELWCEALAMDGWALGLEGGHSNPGSKLSIDGGRTWQSEHMGLYHRLRGEYVVRLRVNDPSSRDADPPRCIWEDRNCALFEEFRKLIPPEVQETSDAWERSRALASWIAQQWTYRNTSTGIDYAPWDPLTILSWAKQSHGHAMARPVVMCVHYGVVFTSAALAIGIPSRNICSTSDLNRGCGHFISEVWMEKWGKWCAIDPTADLVYVGDGVPLSSAELYPNRDQLSSLAVRGTGFENITDDPRAGLDEAVQRPTTYTYWSVWPRNDYLSHPELTPPSHGATAYVESDWLWCRPEDGYDFGMFPYVIDLDRLQEPPPVEWRDESRQLI